MLILIVYAGHVLVEGAEQVTKGLQERGKNLLPRKVSRRHIFCVCVGVSL